MGLLVPIIQASYQQVAGDQFGFVRQRTHVTGDNITSLEAVTGVKKSGVLFEPNSDCVILAPEYHYRDYGQAQHTVTGTGALWKDVLDHNTNKRVLVQYSGTEDISWTATSNFDAIDVDNGGFAVDLYLGAPPKATTTRDASGIYRKVTWAANSASGENRYRVTISYQKEPTIEKSTDSGATWKELGQVPCPLDPQELRAAKTPAPITLTVMVIDKQMVVWLGQDLNRNTFIETESAGYKAGTIQVEGKGGYTSIGYAHLRHKTSGYFISYKHIGPRDMTTPTPTVHPVGTKKADLTAASQTMTGVVETIYPSTFEFDYRVTLTSPELVSDPGFSATTPFVKWVNVTWPIDYDAPGDDGWTDLNVFSYWEKETFDASTRILRRMCKLTTRVYEGELQPLHGVESLRIQLGYQHKGVMHLRGYFVANTEATLYAQGRDSFAVFDGHDFLWFLEPQYLTQQVFPARWCIYSLVRMLLEAGGIVPDFYATLPRKDQEWIDGALTNPGSSEAFCEFGPEPEDCPHTKFETHPGWQIGTPVLAALNEIKDITFHWMGHDSAGQFRFEPFDPAYFTTVTKAFYEAASGDGSDYNEIGVPGYPVLQRTRSVSGVKNDITFIGIDQTTGAFIPKRYSDEASKHTRSAPNYTAGTRPFQHASAVFVDEAFTQEALDKAAKWARLPTEAVMMAVNGQPELHVLDLITARELRTLGGFDVPYLLLDMETTFSPPGTLVSVLQGLWNGLGSPPGVAPMAPRRSSPGTDYTGIPPDARRRGKVDTGATVQ